MEEEKTEKLKIMWSQDLAQNQFYDLLFPKYDFTSLTLARPLVRSM